MEILFYESSFDSKSFKNPLVRKTWIEFMKHIQPFCKIVTGGMGMPGWLNKNVLKIDIQRSLPFDAMPGSCKVKLHDGRYRDILVNPNAPDLLYKALIQFLKNEPLPDTFLLLFKKAKKITDNSYSPYSEFPVGAALITDSGKIYEGCNVENASYGLTICAERNAVFHAVSKGMKPGELCAVSFVLANPGKGKAAPCGACLQVICEFSHLQFPSVIIIPEGKKKFSIRTLDDFLPDGFRLESEE